MGSECQIRSTRQSGQPLMMITAPILRLAAVVLLVAGLAGNAPAQDVSAPGVLAQDVLAQNALAQDRPDDWLTRLFQPSGAASVPGPGAGTREWSGQSGASGHPLMTADAIR